MVMQIGYGMIQMMLVKFMMNDMPHSLGIVPNQALTTNPFTGTQVAKLSLAAKAEVPNSTVTVIESAKHPTRGLQWKGETIRDKQGVYKITLLTDHDDTYEDILANLCHEIGHIKSFESDLYSPSKGYASEEIDAFIAGTYCAKANGVLDVFERNARAFFSYVRQQYPGKFDDRIEEFNSGLVWLNEVEKG